MDQQLDCLPSVDLYTHPDSKPGHTSSFSDGVSEVSATTSPDHDNHFLHLLCKGTMPFIGVKQSSYVAQCHGFSQMPIDSSAFDLPETLSILAGASRDGSWDHYSPCVAGFGPLRGTASTKSLCNSATSTSTQFPHEDTTPHYITSVQENP
jgi:hypothetical protein